MCRRHIQLGSGRRIPLDAVVRQIIDRGGIAGFYRGFLPNAIKNLPNKGDMRS